MEGQIRLPAEDLAQFGDEKWMLWEGERPLNETFRLETVRHFEKPRQGFQTGIQSLRTETLLQ